MQEKIWLSSPHMSGREAVYVKDAFDTNWIAPLGPHVDGFEYDLAAYTGASSVAVLSSGTAAIHLALILLDVGAGDEVICQSFTFSATANPIVYQGALPVFVDSEPATWNMSPAFLKIAIEERLALGKKPKAIIPVHLYGMPSNMPEILAIASQYDIPVIEDAAEALGSHIAEKACGTFGTIGVLSFNGNKIITTSGGGALLSNDVRYTSRAKFLATQARDAAPHYQHSSIGYNYRMSNVCAAIGKGQLEVIEDRVEKRRSNYQQYRQALQALDGISFLDEPSTYFSNRWLTTMLVDPEKSKGISREKIRLELEKNNIESRPLWKPMHCQPVFATSPFYGDGTAEKLFEMGLCLPSGSNLVESQLERIINLIQALW